MSEAPNTFVGLLDQGIVKRNRGNFVSRGHLGYSEIGNEDERELWFKFRWCFPPIDDPRILRIFDLGFAVEDLLADWTRAAGLNLVTHTPDGNQFRFERLGGHLAGSMDGVVTGVPEYPGEWLVWEAKSSNDARFKGLEKLAKDGQPSSFDSLTTQGLREWAPNYWAQVICYMGETQREHAVVVVFNKDNSQIHLEFVDANEMEFQTFISKAERIITAPEPPESIYNSETDWRCKLKMNEVERSIYWGSRLPATANCRNCRFSSPDLAASGGQWYCGLNGTLIGPPKTQFAGCERHQFIPALVPARLLDLHPEGSRYETSYGEFTNGGKPGQHGSTELIELSKDSFAMLADPFYQTAREHMGAKAVRVERIQDAVEEHAKRSSNPEPEKKIWEPFDDDIPF